MEREVESKIISLIEDLQKRMTYLEKKIDILVNQSSDKSLHGKRNSPGTRTGGSQRYSNTRDSRFGAKNTRLGSRPSDGNRQRSEKRVFPKKNQAFKPSSKKRLDKSH